MPVKHYIAYLKERNGAYVYKHHVRFKTGADPCKHLKMLASDWYGGNPSEEDGGYYYNGGEVHVSVGDFKEIDENAFLALDGIVTNMGLSCCVCDDSPDPHEHCSNCECILNEHDPAGTLCISCNPEKTTPET